MRYIASSTGFQSNKDIKKGNQIAIGTDLDGRKDVLGMWVKENESAKFWATVLNGLKNRGLEDFHRLYR